MGIKTSALVHFVSSFAKQTVLVSFLGNVFWQLFCYCLSKVGLPVRLRQCHLSLTHLHVGLLHCVALLRPGFVISLRSLLWHLCHSNDQQIHFWNITFGFKGAFWKICQRDELTLMYEWVNIKWLWETRGHRSAALMQSSYDASKIAFAFPSNSGCTAFQLKYISVKEFELHSLNINYFRIHGNHFN